MNLVTILALVGGGIVLIVVAAFVLNSFSNKKRAEKLKKTLQQFKEESKKMDEPSPLTIVTDEPAVINTGKTKAPKGAIIEDYVDEDEQKEPIIEDYLDKSFFDNDEKSDEEMEDKINWEDFSLFDDDEEEEKKPKKKKKKASIGGQDGFEQFLDEYSYTRKIIDKDLLKKLNTLPPEMKEIILGNVFNKYDE